jgi:hypothetical protein
MNTHNIALPLISNSQPIHPSPFSTLNCNGFDIFLNHSFNCNKEFEEVVTKWACLAETFGFTGVPLITKEFHTNEISLTFKWKNPVSLVPVVALIDIRRFIKKLTYDYMGAELYIVK